MFFFLIQNVLCTFWNILCLSFPHPFLESPSECPARAFHCTVPNFLTRFLFPLAAVIYAAPQETGAGFSSPALSIQSPGHPQLLTLSLAAIVLIQILSSLPWTSLQLVTCLRSWLISVAPCSPGVSNIQTWLHPSTQHSSAQDQAESRQLTTVCGSEVRWGWGWVKSVTQPQGYLQALPPAQPLSQALTQWLPMWMCWMNKWMNEWEYLGVLCPALTSLQILPPYSAAASVSSFQAPPTHPPRSAPSCPWGEAMKEDNGGRPLGKWWRLQVRC